MVKLVMIEYGEYATLHCQIVFAGRIAMMWGDPIDDQSMLFWDDRFSCSSERISMCWRIVVVGRVEVGAWSGRAHCGKYEHASSFGPRPSDDRWKSTYLPLNYTPDSFEKCYFSIVVFVSYTSSRHMKSTTTT
jgi:hypothetical protein